MKVRPLAPSERGQRAEAVVLTSQPHQCYHGPGRTPVCSSGTEWDHWDMTHRKLSTKPVEKQMNKKQEKDAWFLIIA